MDQQTPSTTPETGQTGLCTRCPLTLEYMLRRAIIPALLLIGFGVAFLWDGWVQNKYSPTEKPTAYYMNRYGVILLPIGLAWAAYAVMLWRRALVADAEGIGYVGKDKIRWSQLKRLEIPDKGLLTVVYDQKGAEQTLKLDRYELKNFSQLVECIEAHAPQVPTEDKVGKA